MIEILTLVLLLTATSAICDNHDSCGGCRSYFETDFSRNQWITLLNHQTCKWGSRGYGRMGCVLDAVGAKECSAQAVGEESKVGQSECDSPPASKCEPCGVGMACNGQNYVIKGYESEGTPSALFGCTYARTYTYVASCPEDNAASSGEYFEITDGTSFCEINSAGCITDGSGEYGNGESCVIKVKRDGKLDVKQFDVEDDEQCVYDAFKVGSIVYCGTSSPDGVIVEEGQEMTWTSDEEIVAEGWEICWKENTAESEDEEEEEEPYILLAEGEVCASPDVVIRDLNECREAAALLKLTVSDSIPAWTDITSTIPQGCSIRIPGQDNRLHWEPSSGGVGSGRGDLKPICKRTEQAVGCLNDNDCDHVLETCDMGECVEFSEKRAEQAVGCLNDNDCDHVFETCDMGECVEFSEKRAERQQRIARQSAVGDEVPHYGYGPECTFNDGCVGCHSWYDSNDGASMWINLLSVERCGYNDIQKRCTLGQYSCTHLVASKLNGPTTTTLPATAPATDLPLTSGPATNMYAKETNQLNQALQKENARLRDAIEAAVGVAGSPQTPAYRAGKASKENISAETYNIVDGASHMILYTFAGIGVLFSIYSICTLCEYKNRFYTEVHDLEV